MDDGCLCNGHDCGSPSLYLTFSFTVFLLFSLQQPCCSGLLVLLREPRAWSQVRNFEFAVSSIQSLFPKMTTESLLSLRLWSHVTFCEVLSSYPGQTVFHLPCLQCLFLFPAFFFSINLSHSNAMKYKQPNCLLSSSSPQWDINSWARVFGSSALCKFSASRNLLETWQIPNKYWIFLEWMDEQMRPPRK